MSDRAATLQQLINTALDYGFRDLRTCIPAKVVKWDRSNGRANCQILIQNVTEDETGERVVKSFPVVPGVVVQFPGANGTRMTFPISDGSGSRAATTGTLFFSFRSLDKWLSGSGGEVDPELDHAHALADAIFMPGLMPFGAPWQNVSEDEMTLGDDQDGNGRIHLGSGQVKLGADASKEVVRKGDRLSAAAALATWAANVELALSTVPNTAFAGTLFAAGAGLANGLGTVNEGSAHVKAVD